MKNNSRSESYVAWILNNKVKVILLFAAILIGCASGLRFTAFSNDYRVYFDDTDPQLMAFDALQDSYTKSDNVLFVITPENGDVFTESTIRAVAEITDDAWKIPHSIRVDSITNYQNSYSSEGDLIVEPLYKKNSGIDQNSVESIRSIALNEPALRNRLVSETGHVTGINVSIRLPEGVMEKEVVDYVRNMVEEYKVKYPDLTIDLTGMVMMSNAFPEASEQDIMTLVPLMFAVVFIALRLFFGSMIPAIFTMVIIGLTNAMAIGIASSFGILLSPVSVSAPTIIMTIAVADCVHIIMSFLYYLHQGNDKLNAISESVKVNAKPVFITSLTTAIGFFSMNFSDSPPFRDLGNIVGAGVVLAFFLSMVILPLLLSFAPLDTKKVSNKQHALMLKLSDLVIRYRYAALAIVGSIAIGLAYFAPQNAIDDNFVEYFDKSIDFRRASDYTMNNLTGVNLIEYSFSSGEPDGISKPEYLSSIEAFSEWYRNQPEVIHVSAITDVVKRLNRNIHDDDDAFYAIPSERALAAQNLLLYELSLPFGLDLNNQINGDKSASKVTVLLKTITTEQVLGLEERAQAWLAANAPSIKSVGASLTIMFAHVGRNNIESMFAGTILAFLLITTIILFALRSLKLTLVSLLVNILPSICAFGVWALLMGQVGVAASVVVAMTLGIVVDDTVHFLTKYLHAREKMKLNSYDAVRYAFSTVGAALWVTTAALVGGFSILSFSGFTANGDMGVLTAITIFAALILDLILLPALLIMIDRKDVSEEVVATDEGAQQLSGAQ